MIRFFRSRKPAPLGYLEHQVMDLVWSRGESSVRDIVERMERPLAYTTVMTTLDRLFKKGLLERRKSDRAFVYSPQMTRAEWEQKLAGQLVRSLLADRRRSSDVLISSLVDAVSEQDESLLEDLERKIRRKRRELERQRKK
ncbi:MAG TPA: BlaI/MecI/CopY family transcriptional regulator [Bryobacteraceae bacterium]|nr:BlaI/MecI/CopY family transcriptional regulator [Bryobacteraceae bacterium]